MRRRVNLNVASVLALEALRGAAVLAGRRGLDRRVGGVNIIEVPDVARWLNGREFLLTSAYLWRDELGVMRDLLAELEALGVAALAYKPSVHVPQLPDSVLTYADELAFPIVELPKDLAYREVFESVYMLMFGQHRSTVGPDVASHLGLDPTGHSMMEAMRRLVATFACAFEFVDETEGVAYLGQPGEEIRTRTLSVLEEGVTRPVGEGTGKGCVVPLVVDGQLQGRLSATAAPDTLDMPQMMEIADLLALIQIRRRAYRQGLHAALDLTFRGLAQGRVAEDEFEERAQVLGLSEGASWELDVLVVDEGREHPDRITSQLRRVLDGHLPANLTVVVPSASDGDELVFLVRSDGPQLPELLDEIVVFATSVLGHVPTVAAGRSSSVSSVREVPRALREARIALDAARERQGTAVVGFDDLGAEAVLAQLPVTELSSAFVARRLGCIDDPELLRTLELYVACHGNKSATANAIPMHRSGLLYRLRKLSELLDANVDDPEVMNELWLALKLRRVLTAGN